jgi:DNA-binding NarL/FixJ family response regulator
VLCDDAGFTARSLDNFVWVTFTRSNPSHDVHGVDSFIEHKHWGCRGPIIIDARSKPHHAPPLRVLILTVHAQEEYLLSVLEAGASGYVTKQSADDELREAIRTVARGQVFLYPSGARMLLQQFRAPADSAETDPVKRLSGREREVLRRTAEGFSATEIGESLQISPKTVDTYRQRVMEKLKLSHRSELMRFALREGLLTAAD